MRFNNKEVYIGTNIFTNTSRMVYAYRECGSVIIIMFRWALVVSRVPTTKKLTREIDDEYTDIIESSNQSLEQD